MAAIVRMGPSLTPTRSQNASHSSGLIITGAIDDPFYISSEMTPTRGPYSRQGDSCREAMTTPECASVNVLVDQKDGMASERPECVSMNKMSRMAHLRETLDSAHASHSGSPFSREQRLPDKLVVSSPSLSARCSLRSKDLCSHHLLEEGVAMGEEMDGLETKSPDSALCGDTQDEQPETSSKTLQVASEGNSPFYTCKQMIKIPPKSIEDNYDLPLFFLIRFGGPTSSVGASVLRDTELLKTSVLSQLSYEGIYRYYACMYRKLHSIVMTKTLGKNLDKTKLHRKMSREIPTKAWQTRESLYTKIVEQSTWNPFSIFGSSPPYVSLQEIFNLKSMNNYVTPDVLTRMCRVLGHTRHTLLEHLEKHWRKESHTANWTEDPLLHEEVLWYLKASKKAIDKSDSVYTLQKCYCVTPNPNIRYNWNDPRNAHINQERRRISTWQPWMDLHDGCQKRSRCEYSLDLCGGYLESPGSDCHNGHYGHYGDQNVSAGGSDD